MKQSPSEPLNAMSYHADPWLSSLCRPPRYGPSVNTYYQPSAASARPSGYTRHSTGAVYVWHFGAGHSGYHFETVASPGA